VILEEVALLAFEAAVQVERFALEAVVLVTGLALLVAHFLPLAPLAALEQVLGQHHQLMALYGWLIGVIIDCFWVAVHPSQQIAVVIEVLHILDRLQKLRLVGEAERAESQVAD
jgi:hypothetical protein